MKQTNISFESVELVHLAEETAKFNGLNLSEYVQGLVEADTKVSAEPDSQIFHEQKFTPNKTTNDETYSYNQSGSSGGYDRASRRMHNHRIKNLRAPLGGA